MSDIQTIFRHFLAALSYRTDKTLRGAPEDFGAFEAGHGIRTPAQILSHMNGLIAYSRTFFIGGEPESDSLGNLKTEAARFRALLYSLSGDLESKLPLRGITHEQLLQGPLTDAMTHAGQLALLRRLAGDPITPENFIVADIQKDDLSANRPAP